MSKLTEQVVALNAINKLVRKHFEGCDFGAEILPQLEMEMGLKAHQDITYNVDREAYELIDLPTCKICNHHTDARLLVEIPTATGRFYLCREHYDDISTAKTLVNYQEAH